MGQTEAVQESEVPDDRPQSEDLLVEVDGVDYSSPSTSLDSKQVLTLSEYFSRDQRRHLATYRPALVYIINSILRLDRPPRSWLSFGPHTRSTPLLSASSMASIASQLSSPSEHPRDDAAAFSLAVEATLCYGFIPYNWQLDATLMSLKDRRNLGDLIIQAGKGAGKTVALVSSQLVRPEELVVLVVPFSGHEAAMAKEVKELGLDALAVDRNLTKDQVRDLDNGHYDVLVMCPKQLVREDSQFARATRRSFPMCDRIKVIAIDQCHYVDEEGYSDAYDEITATYGMFQSYERPVSIIASSSTISALSQARIAKKLGMYDPTFINLGCQRPDIFIGLGTARPKLLKNDEGPINLFSLAFLFQPLPTSDALTPQTQPTPAPANATAPSPNPSSSPAPLPPTIRHLLQTLRSTSLGPSSSSPTPKCRLPSSIARLSDTFQQGPILSSSDHITTSTATVTRSRLSV